ncbi:hypothetical protein I4U23_011443 [Adineta vaga]|nr:hypothetical protein I4U23_011443 [Adineta vaga]
MSERQTDNWIQQNVPGGLNGQIGQKLDNMMGGNPNPAPNQMHGGAPGFGNQGGHMERRRSSSSSSSDEEHRRRGGHHGH